MASPGRAILRISIYLALTIAMIPVQATALLLSRAMARRIPLVYHRWCRLIFGITVRVRGTRSLNRPTLFVCNHTSYVDVTVLASVVPACFIAKADVASWPLFGLLARLQRTVFVERRTGRAADQRDAIAGRLARGDSLFLFPEGTTADGMRVLPFKSALFSAAQIEIPGRDVIVQPVSIAYTGLDGMPLGRGFKPFVAWYGDMAMASHLFDLAGLGRITVDLIFHPPVARETFPSRKALSMHCQDVVARGVATANAGLAHALGG